MIGLLMIGVSVVAGVVANETSYAWVAPVFIGMAIVGNGIIALYRPGGTREPPTFAWGLSTIAFFGSIVLIVLALVGVGEQQHVG